MPPRSTLRPRLCSSCTHCKVKAEVLAYCELGLWQKQNGEVKTISAVYVAKSRLAQMATYCGEFKRAER